MAKDMGLKTTEADAPGSQGWASAKRARAKELSEQHETLYMELGRILYEIWDTPASDRPDQKPWYEIWGYESFADYAQRELDLQRRTAERLRRTWYHLEVDLKGINSELKDRIIKLGRSKAYLVLSAMTHNNTDNKKVDFSQASNQKMVEKWVKFAEESPTLKLEKALQKLCNDRGEPKEPIHVKRSSEREPAPAAANGKPEESSEEEEPPEEEPPPANVRSILGARMAATAEPPVAEEKKPEPVPPEAVAPEPTVALADPSPVPTLGDDELPKAKTFSLFKEQRDIVKQALKRAEQLSGSEMQGHNLTLICTDFLATNSFSKSELASRQSHLIKLEKLLGLKIIAFDPEQKEIVFGIKTLERLSQEALAEEPDAATDDEGPAAG